MPIVSLLLILFLLTGCASVSGGLRPSTARLNVQQAPPARLTYVAIGASDTFGTGTADPPTQSWPVDLAGKLGDGVHLVNLGIPGIDAHDALNVELPVALDAHPDLVTIWLAVNDLVDNVPLDSYAHDLDTIVSRLQITLPHTRIIMANLPDLSLLPRFQSADKAQLHARIMAYNSVIADIVARHHVQLVDLYQQGRELVAHPEYISADGFHPNALGYSRLAEIFYQVLQKVNA
jgi:lysophospholipase L1-like esterase